MRAKVEIDLSAIAENIALIQSKTTAQILAVVKANAYGHGLVPVAETALSAGASWLGVALLEEALELRAAGIRSPLIAWLTPPGEDFAAALRNGIDLSIPSLAIFDELLAAADETGITPRIHLEVDTGMSRGGFLTDWKSFLPELVKAKERIHLVGFWSHFARADEPEQPANAVQQLNFELRLNELEAAGLIPEYVHFANSAAALTNPKSHRDIVRLGIAMYGLSPDVTSLGGSEILGLKPAMSLKARLHLVKAVAAGNAIGYGGTAVLDEDTVLGVIPIGYADGIPRNATSQAVVVVNGETAPVIGRVSMDQFVVNLGLDTSARAGDWVTIFGSDGVPVDIWAKAAGTINYEIVTRIAARVPRIYLR
jgi:alanine racemase